MLAAASLYPGQVTTWADAFVEHYGGPDDRFSSLPLGSVAEALLGCARLRHPPRLLLRHAAGRIVGDALLPGASRVQLGAITWALGELSALAGEEGAAPDLVDALARETEVRCAEVVVEGEAPRRGPGLRGSGAGGPFPAGVAAGKRVYELLGS